MRLFHKEWIPYLPPEELIRLNKDLVKICAYIDTHKLDNPKLKGPNAYYANKLLSGQYSVLEDYINSVKTACIRQRLDFIEPTITDNIKSKMLNSNINVFTDSWFLADFYYLADQSKYNRISNGSLIIDVMNDNFTPPARR